MAILFYAKPSFAVWNDTFAGTDFGPPDETKWGHFQSDYFLDPIIYNDALYIDGDGGQWAGSSYHLQGNFDIQIDWSVPTLPTDRYWTIWFGVYPEDLSATSPDEPGESHLVVTRARRAGNGCADEMEYTLTVRNAGVDTYNNTCNNTDTSGKLRLVRINSTAYAYYDNGSGWQLIASDNCTTADGKIWIGQTANGTTGTDMPVSFTNFQINAAGSIATDKLYFTGTNPDKYGQPFDGDNGTIPSGWITTSGTVDSTTTIQSNKLQQYVPGNTTSEYCSATWSETLDGDFDVVVDWDESGADGSWWIADLRAHIDGQNWIRIGRLYTGTDNYRSDTNIGGSYTDGSNTATSDTSGKFRISRYDDTIRVYYWDQSADTWKQTADQNSLTSSSNVTIKLNLNTGDTTPSHTFNWNNFYIRYNQQVADGWSVYLPNNDDAQYVDHGRLICDATNIGTENAWVYWPYYLTGDVDVRVSCRKVMGAPDVDNWGWYLQLWNPSGPEYWEMSRIYTSGGGNDVRSRYDIGAGAVVNTATFEGDYATFRLTRVGTTWSMYYYNLSTDTWTLLDSVTGTTDNMTLWLGKSGGGSSAAEFASVEFYYFKLDGTNGDPYTYS